MTTTLERVETTLLTADCLGCGARVLAEAEGHYTFELGHQDVVRAECPDCAHKIVMRPVRGALLRAVA